MNRKKRILIVAAHPDDEVLGCFGTVARLIKEGYEAYTLILGEGKTSRDTQRVVENKKDEIEVLNTEIQKANELIGIKKIFIESFADNRFDSVDLLDVVKIVSKVKEEIRPDIIFTHFENDLNIDHRITYQAVITATRPMENECVKEIYSVEILSSTEWNYPLSFSPDTYYDISDTIDLKLKAMKKYNSELCQYPHPRSLEGIELNAKYQGMRVGKKYVEAFKSVRVIK
jgi:LmbE family N-acetylglucosaminyl deacetylase